MACPAGRIAALAALMLAGAGPSGFASPAGTVPRRIVFVASSAFNRALRDPAGACYDTRHREILLCDAGNHRVIAFNDSGRPTGEFAHRVSPKNDATLVDGEPTRIAVNSKGLLYIVDTSCLYLDECDYRGRSLHRIDLREFYRAAAGAAATQNPDPVDLDLQPTAVAVDSADNLYVATRTRVFVLNSRHEFLRGYGGHGDLKGQFQAITSIWLDAEGRIYLTDAAGISVQVLGQDGKVLYAFGVRDAGTMNFSMPIGVVTDHNGNMWVADALRHIVRVFKREETTMRALDYIGSFGAEPGQFAHPSGLAYGGNRRLVVVDRVGSRLQCFEF